MELRHAHDHRFHYEDVIRSFPLSRSRDVSDGPLFLFSYRRASGRSGYLVCCSAARAVAGWLSGSV